MAESLLRTKPCFRGLCYLLTIFHVHCAPSELTPVPEISEGFVLRSSLVVMALSVEIEEIMKGAQISYRSFSKIFIYLI
jgi:hypothetical protein